MASQSPRRVALLSVHPRHATAIFSGQKRVELRRSVYPAGASHLLLYSTAPVQRVVGYVVLDHVEIASPVDLWQRHHEAAGISRDEFDEYFAGCPMGAALVIASTHRFPEPVTLSTLLPDLQAPQSYRYLSLDALHGLPRLTGIPAG